MQQETIDAPTSERTIIEAIALKRVIVARYNGNEMRLAPHQLFTRHDALFVAALNTGKNWRTPEERRLGFFKVDGLSEVALTGEAFDPLPDFDETLPGQADTSLFAVAA